jgi:predicted porin
MLERKTYLLASAALAALASVSLGGAQAADLPTMKAAPTPMPAPTLASCGNIQDFFTTACPLTYYGVTFYGTIDVGGGYQTHTTPFNPDALFGTQDLIQKSSNKARWALVPNGLSQSNIGFRVKEEISSGWAFVGQIETGFDPYSLHLANGPRSLADNTNTPLANQTSSGDSSRAGQIFNSQAFAGLSNTTYGTLVVGRVNTLTLDGVNAYDPMGGSYAFSPIGLSGTTAGVGDTETARFNTALKYRVTAGPFRAAAAYQFGTYADGNASNGAFQGEVGADFKGLSVDAIYSYIKDATALSTFNTATVLPNELKMTISDDHSIMLLAKYKWNQFTTFGGFEDVIFANPSGNFSTGGIIYSIGGFPSQVQAPAYNINKTLQIYWTGVKYALNDDVDISGAYYHYHQLNYSGGACAFTSKGSCDGMLNAVSGMVDWRFAKKFDAYAGMMFSEVTGGLANGYLQRNNLDPTVGIRFRF